MTARPAFVALAACVIVGLLPASAAGAASTHRAGDPLFEATIAVHGDGHGRVIAPSRDHTGEQKIVNHTGRELIMVRRHSFRAGRLLADLRHGSGPILPGHLVRDFTVIDTVLPHGVVYTSLRSGAYLIADRGARSETPGDVATVRVGGSHSRVALPLARSEVRVTKDDALAAPDPTYADGVLYLRDNGTRGVQMRLAKLSSRATTSEVSAFTSDPTWRRLSHLPVTATTDLATLSPGRWVSDGRMVAAGRYVIVAALLRPHSDTRPPLRPDLVAAVTVAH